MVGSCAVLSQTGAGLCSNRLHRYGKTRAGRPARVAMTSDMELVPNREGDTTSSLYVRIDPWGLVVVGDDQHLGPLFGEAGRLGFEVFRSPGLSHLDRARLHTCDWVALVVVESGSDLAATTAMLERHVDRGVPLIWVGHQPAFVGHPGLTTLEPDTAPECIAATVFDRARKFLYPVDLVEQLGVGMRDMLADWGELDIASGPVWVKNHFTAPFSLTAVLDVFGDVSGELTLSADREWFTEKTTALTNDVEKSDGTASIVAERMAEAVLAHVIQYLEQQGADLSAGAPTIVDSPHPILRRMSHRPAVCMEFATADGDFVVVEFSGTGIDAIETAKGG
ncbi:MAG: hypothetical protein AAFN74_21560 [Myxococcota bacterium]